MRTQNNKWCTREALAQRRENREQRRDNLQFSMFNLQSPKRVHFVMWSGVFCHFCVSKRGMRGVCAHFFRFLVRFFLEIVWLFVRMFVLLHPLSPQKRGSGPGAEACSLRDFHNKTGSTRVQALAYNAWVWETNRQFGAARIRVRLLRETWEKLSTDSWPGGLSAFFFCKRENEIIYNEEFDPGSGWTLATGLTHASRGAARGGFGHCGGDRRMGE